MLAVIEIVDLAVSAVVVATDSGDCLCEEA